MNSRGRFRGTMRYGTVDRVPCLEEDIREEVIRAWRKQGLPGGVDLFQMFIADRYETVEPDLDPLPAPAAWPNSEADLEAYRRFLDPEDPARLPGNWSTHVEAYRACDHILMLRVHHGFFLAMGVDGWQRFAEVIRLLTDNPRFVQRAMEFHGEFAARMAGKILEQVEIDAAVFVEPIGGNHGPLISPRMYEEFVLKSYEQLLDVLREHCVETLIFKTFANIRILLPAIIARGFNCLWVSEVQAEAMNYLDLRKEFGRDLRLIGGIDLDTLHRSKEDIREEILVKVPPLLKAGGYIPLADGRIREDLPFENYLYYRHLLEQLASGG